MKYGTIAGVVFSFALILSHSYGEKCQPMTLKQTFQDDFLIGAALKNSPFEETTHSTLSMVAQQFNSISPCNMLKWAVFNPKPGVYRHETADAYVAFGRKNNMYVTGHVLFWHVQTPKWVFQNEKGEPVDRPELLNRMRERVRHVSQRYGNRIDAWDVVNEAILDDGTLRDSPWTQILGPDFIDQAFQIADEELPKSVKLLYNDYSMTGERKRTAVIAMIRRLKEKGLRIEGVGLQAHWALAYPSLSEIDASVIAYSSAGVEVHISELDIDVLPRRPTMHAADVQKQCEYDESLDPYRSGLPEDMQHKLAQRYGDIFKLFIKHKDKIKRVTFWGVTDKDSWKNDHPIKGRTNYPLLFDRDGKPKPAFHAVLGIKESDVNSSVKRDKEERPEI